MIRKSIKQNSMDNLHKAYEMNTKQLIAYAKKIGYPGDVKELRKIIRDTLLNLYPNFSRKQKVLDNFIAVFSRFAVEGNQLTENDNNFLLTALNGSFEYFVNILNTRMVSDDYKYGDFQREQSYYFNYINGGLNQDELNEWARVTRFSKDKHVQFKGGYEWVVVLDKNLKPTNYSHVEGKVGKHCGNSYRMGDPGAMISLRKMQPPDVKLTVILDGEGYIVESKGKGNTKLNVKKNQAELKFLIEKMDIVKGNKYIESRYANYQNFYVSDFYHIDKPYAQSFLDNPNWHTSYDDKMMKAYKALESMPDEELFTAINRFKGSPKTIGGKKYYGVGALELVTSLGKLSNYIKTQSADLLDFLKTKIEYTDVIKLFLFMPKNIMSDVEVMQAIMDNENVVSSERRYTDLLNLYYENINDIEAKIKPLMPVIYRDKLISSIEGDTIRFFFNNVEIYTLEKDNRWKYDIKDIGADKLIISTNSFNVSKIVKIYGDGNVTVFQNRALGYKRLTEEVISYGVAAKGAKVNHLHNLTLDRVIHQGTSVNYALSGHDFSVITPISTSIINKMGETVVDAYTSITLNVEMSVFHAITPEITGVVKINASGDILETFEVGGLKKTMKVINVVRNDNEYGYIELTNANRTKTFKNLINSEGTIVNFKEYISFSNVGEDKIKAVITSETNRDGKVVDGKGSYDYYDMNGNLLVSNIIKEEEVTISNNKFIILSNILNRNSLYDENLNIINTYGKFFKRLYVDKFTQDELDTLMNNEDLSEDMIDMFKASGEGNIETITTINGRTVTLFDAIGNELYKVTAAKQVKKPTELIGTADLIDFDSMHVNRFGQIYDIVEIINKTRLILKHPNGLFCLYNTVSNDVLSKPLFTSYENLYKYIYTVTFENGKSNIMDLSGKYKFKVNGNYEFRYTKKMVIAKDVNTDEDVAFYNMKSGKLVGDGENTEEQHDKNYEEIEEIFDRSPQIASKRRRREEAEKRSVNETELMKMTRVNAVRTALANGEYTEGVADALKNQVANERKVIKANKKSSKMKLGEVSGDYVDFNEANDTLTRSEQQEDAGLNDE